MGRVVIPRVALKGVIFSGAAEWRGAVESASLTAPPGSPGVGDRYIVAAPATGAWTGHEDDIAEWDGGSWDFLTPQPGWTCWVKDVSELYVWNGSTWEQESFGPHASTHENGGADEISVAGLSGLLADPQTPLAHSSTHKDGGSDEVATLTPAAGAIPKADGTGKLPVGFIPATFPAPHSSSHEDGGSDEISVAGLSGVLADEQNPVPHATEHVDGTDDIRDATASLKGLATAAHISKLDGIDPGADVTGDNPPQAHAASHENGGTDEIGVAGLTGLLADAQTPLAHASTHKGGGTDEIDAVTSTVNGLMSATDKARIDKFLPTEANTTTTDATPTNIASIPIPDNTAMLIIANVVGRRTDSPDRACYVRRVLVYREAGGGATIQSLVDADLTRESDANWDATFQTSGNNINIVVMGRTGHTVNWNVWYTMQERG